MMSTKDDRLDDLLAKCNEAIEQQPGLAHLYIQKGSLLQSKQRYIEALATFEQARHLDPDNPEIALARGTILLALHRPHDALIAFELALELDPTNENAHQGQTEAFSLLQ
jgi:cytochrome c-type biogenesis protein CcmH/NrfG